MAEQNFKDHFSAHASDYQSFRPGYPGELFRFLATLPNENQLAWDCATGNGQAANLLSEYFRTVVATDASTQQVQNAANPEHIIYRVEPAEHSSLDSQSVDLITVAQALHWFDLDAFSTEVDRVLKPGGVLAAWTYNLVTISDDIDPLIYHLYADILGDYWSFERSQVENGYADITLPLISIEAPAFSMQCHWQLPQLLGYLSTWSALKCYQQENKSNPLKDLDAQFHDAWKQSTISRPVNWPLTLKLWKKE